VLYESWGFVCVFCVTCRDLCVLVCFVTAGGFVCVCVFCVL
jgi:hypothetical protein